MKKVNDMNIASIKIDPEFSELLPAMSAQEYDQLEKNILEDGEVRDPLVIWGDTLIDGHHRLKIIKKHPDIPYTVKEVNFPDRWAAIAWICRKQVGQRNMTELQEKMVMAEALRAREQSRGNNAERGNDGKYLKCNPCTSGDDTASEVADEYNVSRRTVYNAAAMKEGVDAAEAIDPGFRQAVLNGDIKASQQALTDIAKVSEDRRPAYVEAVKSNDVEKMKDIKKSEYDLNDFQRALHGATVSFDDTLGQVLNKVNDEIIGSAEYCSIALAGLQDCTDTIEKYKEVIDGYQQ